eukprot:6205075-Pleurochrysis_carterae.AAC.1
MLQIPELFEKQCCQLVAKVCFHEASSSSRVRTRSASGEARPESSRAASADFHVDGGTARALLGSAERLNLRLQHSGSRCAMRETTDAMYAVVARTALVNQRWRASLCNRKALKARHSNRCPEAALLAASTLQQCTRLQLAYIDRTGCCQSGKITEKSTRGRACALRLEGTWGPIQTKRLNLTLRKLVPQLGLVHGAVCRSRSMARQGLGRSAATP